MFPKLRVILTAAVTACVAVLAASVGLIGTRDPAKQAVGVPDVSRSMMQQAIMEAPEWQNFQLLAYSRRADELLRLRDLPVAPARAVVELAERAQSDAAVARTEPADDGAASKTAALPSNPPESTTAGAAGPDPVPEAVTTEPAAGGNTPVASLADGPGETAATASVTAPEKPWVGAGRRGTKVVARPRKKKRHVAAAAGASQVATVQQDAGAAASAAAAPKPSVGAKTRSPKVAARPRKKKVHVIRAPRAVPPVASTGFPVDVQTPNDSGPATTTTTRVGAGSESGR